MNTYEAYIEELGIDLTYLNTPNGGFLNPALVVKQKLTVLAIDRLKELHGQRGELVNQMRESDDAIELRRLAKEIDVIDFALQEAWGFTQDANYHEWYNLPKCSCPKMDNQDARGTPYRVYSSGCIIHAENKMIDNDRPVVI